MQIKLTGEQPFQVLSTTFTIGPSTSGYDLYFSADGVNYTQLFTVGANVNRQVTQVAAGSYYKLVGNTGNVVVNWYGNCVVDSGGGGGQYVLPVASQSTLGGVKIGSGITIDSGGTISAEGGTSVTYLNEGIEVDFNGGYLNGDIEAFLNSINTGITPGSEYAMPTMPIYTINNGYIRLCKITSLVKHADGANVIYEVENADFNTGAGDLFNEFFASISYDENEGDWVWEVFPLKCLGTPGANKIDLTDEGMPTQGGLRPDVIWMLMMQGAGEPNNFDFSIKCEALNDETMHYGAVKTWDYEEGGLGDYSGITGYTEFMNIGAEVAGMDWEARIVRIYGIEEEPTQQEMETFEDNYGVYTYNEVEDWYEIYFYEVLKWEPAGGQRVILLNNLSQQELVDLYDEITAMYDYQNMAFTTAFTASNYEFYIDLTDSRKQAEIGVSDRNFEGWFPMILNYVNPNDYDGGAIYFTGVEGRQDGNGYLFNIRYIVTNQGDTEPGCWTVEPPQPDYQHAILITSGGTIENPDGLGIFAAENFNHKVMFVWHEGNDQPGWGQAPLKYVWRKLDQDSHLIYHFAVDNVPIDGVLYKGTWHVTEDDWGNYTTDTWTTV